MPTKLTEREIEECRRVVSNALASQRLEGLEVDPETIADLERCAVLLRWMTWPPTSERGSRWDGRPKQLGLIADLDRSRYFES